MFTKSYRSIVVVVICLTMLTSQYCYASSALSQGKEASRQHHSEIAFSGRGGFAPPYLPPPSLPEEAQVGIELSEGSEKVEHAEPNKIAAMHSISTERVQELLKRLPPAKPSERSADFNIPFSPNPPARPGKIVKQEFPPKESAAPEKPKLAPQALKVLRHSPEGSTAEVQQVSVTFSQPMVPVAAAESDVLANTVPVHITPQPPGKWRWVGTQTLVFTPDGKHLPGATQYKVEVSKNTKSVLGGVLPESTSWSISTPAVLLQSFSPSDGETTSLTPLMLAIFNQNVSKANLLNLIKVITGKSKQEIRLATEQEIAADKTVTAQVKGLDKNRWVAFKCTQALSPNQGVQVQFGPKLQSAEGPILSKATQTYSFQTYPPFTIQSPDNNPLSPDSGIYVYFSNGLDTESFKTSYVSIKPTVPNLVVSPAGSQVTMEGDFKANTKYTVSFDRALRDEYKQALSGANSVSINVGQSSPQLLGTNDMVVLKPSKQPVFNFQTRNVKQVKVSAYAAKPEDYTSTYSTARQAYSEWHEKVADYPEFTKFKKLDSKLISIKSDVESYVSTSVDLKPYLKNGLGHVILTVEKLPRVQNEGVMRFPVWIQVTNLGIDAYNDADTLLAMVSKLDDGSPISNAELTLTGSNISAQSNKSGIAVLHLNTQYSPILLAKNGDDVAFLNSYGNWRLSNRQDMIRWYSVTDRNLYKPGEHVQVKGWARRFGSGPKADISLLGSTVNGLDYQINDANGSDLGKGHCAVDDSGAYDFAFDIPKTANLGTATIRLAAKKDSANIGNLSNEVGTCNFTIQEFRRPEFEMNVKSSKGGSMILGDTTDITASAKYFAGGALPDAPVHWTVTCSEGSFSPPGFDDFNFGRKIWPYAYFFGIRPMPGGKTKVSQFDGKTDGNGKHVLAVKLKSLPELFPESVVAEGTVSDVNRQEWSDKATILVHPADVYVGVKTNKQFYHSNDPVLITSVVADLDGKVRAGNDVHIEVSKERSVFKDNKYQNVKDQLASKDFKSTDKPSDWTIDLKEGGSIKIEAVVTDSHGRKNKTEMAFYREDKQPEENKKVEKGKILLISDKTKYEVGETAEILVQAPVADCHGLVTVRRNGIASSEPINISGASTTIKIPVTEQLIPNATVQVDLDGPNCAYSSGEIALNVSSDTRKLKLDVSAEKKELSPGEKTRLVFKLKDKNGKGTKSQVAVAVVDESVLALSGYDWSDPSTVFYTPTSADTQDLHSRQYIILPTPVKPPAQPRRMFAPAPMARSGAGGGFALGGAFLSSPKSKAESFADADARDGSANIAASLPPPPLPGGADPNTPIALRTNFSALAYFNPSITTDNNGEASCEVQLPDNLTRYRIMAVAASGDRLFGQGESTLTARLPLMVRPSAPRFLNFGDKCELPVVIQNQTDHEMSVDLGLRADNLKFIHKTGEGGEDKSNAQQSGASVLVPANDRVEVRFPAATDADGNATIDIAAASGEYADAANVVFPVYTPATTHAFAAYGQIDEGGAEQMISVPKDVYDQIGGLDINTSSTALQSLTDAYIYLHDYSFACSEQLSSRVLATTALQDTLTAFGKIDQEQLQKIKKQTQDDIDLLCQRQKSDGSFALWRLGENGRWPFLAVQVSRALNQAKSKGYNVSDDVLSKAKSYLSRIETQLPKPEYDTRTALSIRSYALFVLSLMQNKDAGKAREIIRLALKTYKDEQKDQNFKNQNTAGLEKDQLPAVLSMESIGWLLPVISGDKNSSAQTALLRSIISDRTIETASTAEIKSSSYGEWDYHLFYSPNRVDAVILESLIIDQPKNDVIPKLANGLLAHRKAGKWCSTQENSAALIALDRYFSTYENISPDFVARTWLGDQFVGQSKFAGRSTDTLVTTVPMRYLEAHPNDTQVLLSKDGPGRLYYRVALNYAPKTLMLPAYDNGFQVKRSYEAVDDPKDISKDSNGVWHFKSGATIKAKIELSAPSRRYHVALTDPLPAGAEPVNGDLKGTQETHVSPEPDDRVPPELNSESSDDSSIQQGASYLWFPWWNQNWYEHQNLRDFRAEAFTSLLWGGKFTYTYTMRATTPGEFIVPSTKVEEMYTPETFGRSASDRVIIE